MRIRLACALLLATCLLTADARTQRATPRPPDAPTSRRDAPVPFAVGETLTYDVSFSDVLSAGTAVVRVQDRRASQGSTAYTIVAEGRPLPLLTRFYQLYYRMDTLVDTVSLLSQRGSLYAEEGRAHRTSITQFDRAGRRVMFEEQSDSPVKLGYAVPPQTQDGLSTLYWLRARTFRAGERLTFPVADSGSLYTVDVNVGGPEVVRTGVGDRQAWRLTGTIKDSDGSSEWKNIGAWISTDARRLPVKLQAELPYGAFVLSLRDAK